MYSPAKVCNLYLNRKGFYGDENIEVFWPREALCIPSHNIQTLAAALSLRASSVMQIDLMFYSAVTDERINLITGAGDSEGDVGKQIWAQSEV